MLRKNYKPDVLTCIADLSSDEVFTPPRVANQMLDMLPIELWSNEKITFLDPVSKSGVFLREITKRLIDGLESKFPILEDRVEHILRNQVFGIATTELTSLISRRTLYCSKYADGKYSIVKFDDKQGNLKYFKTEHSWEGKYCKYCGIRKKLYDRGEELESYAYSFIHTENPEKLFNMKYDIIVGNPPYQMNDGGSGTGISAKPIYHLFIDKSKNLSPKYISMIIPSRWFSGGKGLNDFREKMLNDKRLRRLVDYPKSRDCFPGVDIAGGVCYFLWEKDNNGDCSFSSHINGERFDKVRDLSENEILIRDLVGITIIKKIINKENKFFNKEVLSRNPFGFISSSRGNSEKIPNYVKLINSQGVGYVGRHQVKKNSSLIDLYKVYIGKVNPDRGGVNNSKDGKSKVLTKIKIAYPNEVTSETYLVLSFFNNKKEAQNCSDFFKTKFSRFLVFITLSSMNITKSNFQFVPVMNFTESWTDNKLYSYFDLTEGEILHIENQIKSMDLNFE